MPEQQNPDGPVPATAGEPITRVFDVFAGRVEARDGAVLRRLGQVLGGALTGSPASRTPERTSGDRASESESIESRADGRQTPWSP